MLMQVGPSPTAKPRSRLLSVVDKYDMLCWLASYLLEVEDVNRIAGLISDAA